ncbi:MAG: class I SAM-dependent methyltransferase [Albidovulum sp.]|nr:class I SAM-dependent methyltransferase [Albidovulum sp.]MDE0532244.1 class I SAM-dependent methyltransferase [Albidovulum sp.]
MSPTSRNSTHFGFSSVPEEEKLDLVQNVFSSVSNKYDIMNDAMSLGIHRLWKDALVDWLAPRERQELLDLAGGTGDIASRFLKRSNNGRAVVLDINESMLESGRSRASGQRMQGRIEWILGNAEMMPFATGRFDACTIGFGARNFAHLKKGLMECRRVLKTGGRLLVLEFSQFTGRGGLKPLYDAYSFRVIPKIGEIIANDGDSYRYLVESIRKFPDQDEFAAIIRDCGFGNVKYRNLSFGIVAIHSGWKI